MRRRDFIALVTVTGTAAAFRGRALAQSALRRPLVAYLSINVLDARMDRFDTFVDSMRNLGWVEGQNYSIEFRSSEGINERLPTLTNELLALKPDVFVGEGTRGATAAAQATSTLPIVGPTMGEATAIDLGGANFAHPKGNVTGLLVVTANNVAKELELAAEIIPRATRFAYLADAFTVNDLTTADVQKAVAALHASLVWVSATAPTDLPAVVDNCVRERVDVAVVSSGALYGSEAPQLIALMAAARMPAIYSGSLSVRLGGLASYGVDLSQSYRRAADYVNRILKGAKPADLPIEVPSPVLAVNLKTAKSLGLTIPPTVLFRADEVIGE